jgi:cyclopropane-fatty-acyl-phospholipid synthase
LEPGNRRRAKKGQKEMRIIESFVRRQLEWADIRVNGDRPQDIKVLDNRFYTEAAFRGSLGVGEAYMNGYFECDSIFDMCRSWLSKDTNQFLLGGLPTLTYGVKSVFLNLQNLVRAEQDVSSHYDIGNDLYERMLGPSWTYSCAYWGNALDVTAAQYNKHRLNCMKLYLEPGMRVLDIGCGWGTFAKFAAAEYGVNVVGVTLSKEQATIARERCKGLPVEIRLLDYRRVPEEYPASFDRVSSVGMLEHVGPKNYPKYFKVAAACLVPHGLLLQHQVVGWGTDPFINEYIFPNGVIPREAQIAKAAKKYLVAEDMQNMGFDYYKTAKAWYDNCKEHEPELRRKNPKYDDRFWRMWYFYLGGTAATFFVRRLQLQQWIFSKGGVPGGYVSIRPTFESNVVQLHKQQAAG